MLSTLLLVTFLLALLVLLPYDQPPREEAEGDELPLRIKLPRER